MIMINRHKLTASIENDLDSTFRAQSRYVDTMDEFYSALLQPYLSGERIFYRGERKSSNTRPLLPSMYRRRELLFDSNAPVAAVDCGHIMSVYSKYPEYIDLYEHIDGKITADNMYRFLAFSQHYFGLSPLLDFSKNIYAALSFALKDRETYQENILLYTISIIDDADYTDSIDTANRWINEYSVVVLNHNTNLSRLQIENPFEYLDGFKSLVERFKTNGAGETFWEITSPSARLIDVPTNDLMRYQQGVFLLLDDFTLFGNSYLTKRIRDNFRITKWSINRSICPELYRMVVDKMPYYAYRNITDLHEVVAEIKRNNELK